MRYIVLGIVMVLFCGCSLPEVRIDVVSERTALENQVLGSYNALDKETMRLASVRGVSPLGEINVPPEKSAVKEKALEAMRIQAFHEDDLQNFKKLHWVGENNQGLLTAFGMQTSRVPENLRAFAGDYSREQFAHVVEEINAARTTIMHMVVMTNENFTEDDLPRIKQIFAGLRRQNSLPGGKIQNEQGEWTTREAK